MTVAASPVWVPAAPETVNDVPPTTLPAVGPVMVTTGAVVSCGVVLTVNVTGSLLPMLPAVSTWVACTVQTPAASVVGVALHVPFAPTVACTVWAAGSWTPLDG